MNKPKRSQSPADRIAFFVLKKVRKALRDFRMIQPNDRIAVAVSGGKDSLALLRLLQIHRRASPVPYELAALHVCGDSDGVTPPHPALENWLSAGDVSYRFVTPEIGENEALPMNCQRCTWLRRKALFLAAEMLDYNVVAFAHHADDVAQTTLMNLLYGGTVRTLAPCADYFGGRFRVIRPLVYVPEDELIRLARAVGFPPPPPTCSRSEHTSRRCIAEMLQLLGRDYPMQARPNLVRVGLAPHKKTGQ